MPTPIAIRIIVWVWLIAVLFVAQGQLPARLSPSLLPTFLVPLIIAPHAMLVLRPRAKPGAA